MFRGEIFEWSENDSWIRSLLGLNMNALYINAYLMKPLWINYFSNLFISGVSLNNFIYFCEFSEVNWTCLD